MITSLSKSLKAIALNDATKKLLSASAPSLSTQIRFKSVEEKLGLPAKPKKPTPAYFRFANENRPSVMTKHPKLKTSEISSILGKMWQALEPADRENYRKDYETALIKYSTEYDIHKSSLSYDDKRLIKEMKVEEKERRALLEQKRRLRKLGKPKKPMSAFIRYFTMQTDRKENEHVTVHAARITSRWNELSKTEKEKYKTSAEEEAAYKIALCQWKQKILKLELDDVVVGAKKKNTKESRTVASDK